MPEDDPDLLRNRPILDRALVISAGVLANCVLAFAVCVAQAGTVGVSGARGACCNQLAALSHPPIHPPTHPLTHPPTHRAWGQIRPTRLA